MSTNKRHSARPPAERRRTWTHLVVIVALSALAIAQLTTSGKSLLAPDPGRGLVTVGHDLSGVSVLLSDGTVARMGNGRGRLLLVFDPDCPHSNGIALEWSTWLSSSDGEGNRILAVSPGSLPEAVMYARDHQWSVRVGALEGTTKDDRALAARTPWVFALNRDGRVVEEAHGSRLTEVAQRFFQLQNGVDSNEAMIRQSGNGQVVGSP